MNVNIQDGRSHVKIGPSNCLLAVSRYLLRGKHVERHMNDTNKQSTIHLMIFWCLSRFFGGLVLINTQIAVDEKSTRPRLAWYFSNSVLLNEDVALYLFSCHIMTFKENSQINRV